MSHVTPTVRLTPDGPWGPGNPISPCSNIQEHMINNWITESNKPFWQVTSGHILPLVPLGLFHQEVPGHPVDDTVIDNHCY